MKKINLIFIAIIMSSFSFYSCSEEDSGVDPGKLIAKWEYFQEGEVINGQEILMTYEHSEGCEKDFIEILSNGTVRDVSYYFNNNNPCFEDVYITTWSVNSNNFTTTFLGYDFTTQVLTLNATTLKVKYNNDEGTFITVYRKAN